MAYPDTILLTLIAFLASSTFAAPTDFFTRLVGRGNEPRNSNAAFCSRLHFKLAFIGTHESPFFGPLIPQNREWILLRRRDTGIRFLQSQIHSIKTISFICRTHCSIGNAGPVEDSLEIVKQWSDENAREVVILLMSNPGRKKTDMDNWASVF